MSSLLNDDSRTATQEPDTGASDAAAFCRVVESRRAVRVFTSDALPQETLREILRLAHLAPSSSNLQMWEFVVVGSAEKKNAVVEACLSQTAAKTAAELVVCVTRLCKWPKVATRILQDFDAMEKVTGVAVPAAVRSYYGRLIPFILRQGPLGIFGLAKRALFFARGFKTATPRGPVSHADMRVWAHKSTALACENLMLAARAHGFDSCPLEGFDAARLAKALALPLDAEVCMVVALGKRAPEGIYGPRMRLPLNEVVKFI